MLNIALIAKATQVGVTFVKARQVWEKCVNIFSSLYSCLSQNFLRGIH